MIIIPIEIKVRELHGKCLLAYCAAEAGLDVVLGDQRIVARSLHRLQRGIYVDKSISRTKTRHYRKLKQLGFSVAAWCEEGLVYRDKGTYQLERVSQDSAELVDAFIAWGEVQRDDVVEAAPGLRDKTFVHGNPRFDMLRPAYRAVFQKETDAIARQHGPFILVNTNFARYNHFRGRDSTLEVMRERGIVTTPEQADYYIRLGDYLGALFGAFVTALPEMANAFPDHSIIVRPHPSEDHERWRREVAGLPNVHVIYEGSVLPWILSAGASVQNSCTTGVEAFLLDRPTVAYMPVTHEVFDSLLPNSLGDQAKTPKELIEALRRALSGDAGSRRSRQKKDALVARYIANSRGPLASDRFVETLLEMSRGAGAPAPGTFRVARAHLEAVVRKLAGDVRRTLRGDKRLADYMDQKFPGLTLDEVQSIFDGISVARGKRDGPRVSAHPDLPSCFLVTAS